MMIHLMGLFHILSCASNGTTTYCFTKQKSLLGHLCWGWIVLASIFSAIALQCCWGGSYKYLFYHIGSCLHNSCCIVDLPTLIGRQYADLRGNLSQHLLSLIFLAILSLSSTVYYGSFQIMLECSAVCLHDISNLSFQRNAYVWWKLLMK